MIYSEGIGNFLYTTASRPALASTQPPIQWIPGALFRGVELYFHSSNTPSWRGSLLKHRDNFTFYRHFITTLLLVHELFKIRPYFHLTECSGYTPPCVWTINISVKSVVYTEHVSQIRISDLFRFRINFDILVGLLGWKLDPSQGLYLHRKTRISMPRAGFEPMILELERSKTIRVLDRAITGIKLGGSVIGTAASFLEGPVFDSHPDASWTSIFLHKIFTTSSLHTLSNIYHSQLSFH
jgi:hypothetical protein